MRYGSLAWFAVLGLVGLARISHAQGVTVTLDNPNQTVALPASGTVTLNFIGTVAFGANTQYSYANLTYALNSAGESLTTAFGPLNFDDANNGGSVHGVLFTAQVSSTTTPGLFEFAPMSTDPAFFSVTGTDGTTVSQNFSVRVTAVPEVSTFFGVGLFMGIGGIALLRRRCLEAR